MTVRLLLINPKFPESFWSFKWAVAEILPGKRGVNPPLGLATLAALCPQHWHIEIVDENIEPVPLKPQADLIGVCGMGVQFRRQTELLAYYRGQGYFTVAGGSYASLCPELYAELANTVVAGEAEYVWKEFCRDYEQHRPLALYRETRTVALADSPVPRFDLLKLEKYTTATLQFSRGCPYRCEFCDIIVMFGRRPRWKTLAQVGAELDVLRSRHVRNAFFVDDNLIGHRAAARELLRFLRAYQERHGYWFRFGTEASLNLAQDKELLQLFREANFIWVFIGIESPDEKALRETHKTQNLHEDILTSVRRIYAHGIDVLAGFIVGFDSDTLETFDHQYRFIVASGIQVAMIGLLTALPKTPLHERLAKEGRLLAGAANDDNTKVGTNFIPKNMRYDDMVRGYVRLYQRLLTDRAIAERVRNKMKFLKHPVYHGEYAAREKIAIVVKLIARGIVPGGVRRLFHFIRSLPWGALDKMPLAIVDWIGALAMRDYVDRHLSDRHGEDSVRAGRWFAKLERTLKRHLRDGRASVELQLFTGAVPRLEIHIRGQLDRAFFSRCARRLEGLLKRTHATVTLVVEEMQHPQLQHLHRLLQRLARYGNRIFIEVDEQLRQRLSIDSSVFNLSLASGPAQR